MSDFSEDALVEKPAIEMLKDLGWEHVDAFHEFEQTGGSPLGRETKSEVVLVSRLKPALEKLNPALPAQAVDLAIEEILRDRSRMSLAAANKEVYDLIKNGIRVEIPDPDGEDDRIEVVRVIDWEHPEENDFLLCSQLWITGDMYTRRPDLVGFVNGLPLVLMEFKAVHQRLETAYTGNVSDYRDTIPHLFWFNGLIILSNGSQSKVGSVSAGWEHFGEWKRVKSETEAESVSLETIIRGTCDPVRLLDLLENFSLFMDAPGGLIKIVAKNHQYLGVNNALEAMTEIKTRKGRLGVFWHTQGSGKSVSMIFFSQKVLRKMLGNWTFVIVTDRKELDGQIYKNFASSGVVTESKPQAESSRHLRRLLTEDHRYVFTLIHKFRTETDEAHPVLSERDDIIVITDEAHRSQYDRLALNMRTALPNASFLAFTGTPLIAEEEKTREVFGEYVSIYDFKQSADDGATVPLYYENRIPELQLSNENLNEDMERLLEDAELDEEQERLLEREFAREYHLITRDDRLEAVAEDIVKHFTNRGFWGKAMVVCVDKATAVRMYEKVRKYWKEALSTLMDDVATSYDERQEELKEKLAFMGETDMAVVVSQAQNEIRDMKEKGLDIRPHRKRMVEEDLDTKFKDPDDPFRLVFVCAMWMTGFDVPSCSTIYLDKPMRNHTLMQTIARANRVFPEKVNGLIVDYVGVFRSLEKALAIYGSGTGGVASEGEKPIREKATLVEDLKKTLQECTEYCKNNGIDVAAAEKADAMERIRLLDDAVEALVKTDDIKKGFLNLADQVERLYKAVLPDPAANVYAGTRGLFKALAGKIRSLVPPVDITGVMNSVEDLLDRSISTEGYVIEDPPGPYGADHLVDLSRIDFEALRQRFEQGRKRTEAEKIKGAVARKLRHMVRMNRSRMNYLERFQQMIDAYNAGSVNIEEFFRRLMDFAQDLNDEEKRTISEQLSEEELAFFDLLTKPEPELAPKERGQVKKTARELLNKLKGEKLVLDWRKRQQSRADVRVTIERMLDRGLPEVYTQKLFEQKTEAIFQHIYESYYGAGKGIYAAVM
ncbi:MAG: type I restriction endonuclease subunit R [Desulfobacteraceae bacterium]|nr:type I restriction endonuclease subunit R [Desulfobacterales bacterium]MBL6967095.1 type I restriction endonuclease subunit R [Desulfobacteraceae bacterium]MBL7101251.1 type I restriction endonuclease subunit R [Desulfobacteraceae bacterium]MBL7171842.1 type I restriction endonuclease subunit R [Desulfobacteraceae bacterium]MBU0734678.1 type I restriction endonuclease subunit R [Pseudomonadota bacterium]